MDKFRTITISKNYNRPRKSKNCDNCGISNNLAKICKKPIRIKTQTLSPQQTDFNQFESTPDKSDDGESVNYVTSYRVLYDQVYNSNYDSDTDNYVAAISSETANQLENLNAKIQFGNIHLISMIDSSSVCSIITKGLARNIPKTTPTDRWSTTTDDKDMKIFSNKPIEVWGKLATTFTYINLTFHRKFLTDYGHKSNLGRDMFNSLGLAVVQNNQKGVNALILQTFLQTKSNCQLHGNFLN